MRQVTVLFFTIFMFHFQLSATEIHFETDSSKIKFTEGKTENYLQSVGQGLRRKKVAFMKFDVYTAELFISDPKSYDKALKFESLSKQSLVGIKVNFLRDVESTKVIDAFEQSLKKNQAQLDSAGIKDFLEQFRKYGDVKKGQGLIVVGNSKSVYLKIGEMANKLDLQKLTDAPDLFKNIFSIWLGVPVDDQLQDMQNSIFK